MRHFLFFAFLLLPFTVSAQTVQDFSFETLGAPLASDGPYNKGPIPGWTMNGTGTWVAGQLQPAFSVPDGITVAWVDGGFSISQDLGTVAAGTYSLAVSVGLNTNYTGTYTVSLGICSQSGTATSTFAVVTVANCAVPAGDLQIKLAAGGQQVLFDKVVLTTPGPPPSIVTFTFPVQLTTCTKCDGTDDQGAAALGLFAGSKISISSGSSAVCSGVLNANAQMSCSAGIDISPAMIPLSLTVVSGDGSTSYTDSQQILGILFMGRNVINVVALFDATNLQPRGLRVWSQ